MEEWKSGRVKPPASEGGRYRSKRNPRPRYENPSLKALGASRRVGHPKRREPKRREPKRRKPKTQVHEPTANLGHPRREKDGGVKPPLLLEGGVVVEGDEGVRMEFVVVAIGKVGAVVAAAAFFAG